MEVKIIGQMDNTIDHTFESANRVYDTDGLSPTINTCGGGGLDGSFPSSKTRRGRVQGDGNICPTITAQNQELYRLEKCECNEPGAVILYMPETDQYYMVRIRKLTIRECLRLMCVNDDDISKMEEVNSRTQCYKQAGNSICVDVMTAMFGQLIEGKENVYKE